MIDKKRIINYIDLAKPKGGALVSGWLRCAANSSVVPTKFATEWKTRMKSSKADFVTCTFHLPPKRN